MIGARADTSGGSNGENGGNVCAGADPPAASTSTGGRARARTFSTILLSCFGELYKTAADIGNTMYSDILNASKKPFAIGSVCGLDFSPEQARHAHVLVRVCAPDGLRYQYWCRYGRTNTVRRHV